MSVITVSRKLGSYGGRIAERLANELGWKFADRYFIDEVISEYGLIRLGDLYENPPTLMDLFDEDTSLTIEWMNKTGGALAANYDVVILGRGGFAALQGFADVFNVLITAPDPLRVRRVMVDEELDEAAAQERVKFDQLNKTRFVRRYYGAKWADNAAYDLVVDTAEVSEEEAVQQILDAAKAYFANADGPRVAGTEVDAVLAKTIKEHFERREAGGKF